MFRLFIPFVLILFVLTGCGEDEMYIPKPPAYLRMEFPETAYSRTTDDCPYSLDLASYMTSSPASTENPCHRDINLGLFNGIIHLSYLTVDTLLAEYINYSIQKVEEHIVKAAAIEDTNIILPEKRIYGTFFEIQGNAASPFQFYFTDSVNHFIRGAVFFNAKPNYDSIYPVLEYVKKDLLHLISETEWK
jgi:gliding motility-associated lipoprotein GldD